MSVRKRAAGIYQLDLDAFDYPVVMPGGELDIIPSSKGKIITGSTHNEMGFDLTVDQALLNQMETTLFTIRTSSSGEVVGSAWEHGPAPVTFHPLGSCS